MTKKTVKCLAMLKNELPCPYKGKPEYNGYCGIHKAKPALTSIGVKRSRGEQLAQLISAGAALTVLLEKSVEYLPNLIEVFVTLAHLGSSPYESSTLRPKDLPDTINFLIENQSWQQLVDHLSYDFDVKINSGNVPSKLLTDIRKQQGEVFKELTILGYEASPTARRLEFSRRLD